MAKRSAIKIEPVAVWAAYHIDALPSKYGRWLDSSGTPDIHIRRSAFSTYPQNRYKIIRVLITPLTPKPRRKPRSK